MRPAEVLASVLFFTSACTCTASRAAGWAPIEALNGAEPLLRRQAADSQTTYDLSYTGQQGNTATTESTATATQTSDDNSSDATTTGEFTNTDNNNSSGTNTRSGTGSRKSGSATKTFDARLPAGGVSMITPNALTTKYYKIQDYITFAWNYTSLSVTPSAIDIMASCSKNQETYTLAMNVSVQETQSFTWDTGAFQASATVPLLTETYTLLVYDAAGAVTDRAQAGYLAPYNQFTFGMYSPQAYTPMVDYVCATCNAASSLEKQTWLALLGMVCVTVVTFGWFTGIAGLW